MSKRYTMSTLSAAFAEELRIPKEDAHRFIRRFLRVLRKKLLELQPGDEFPLRGLGVFTLRKAIRSRAFDLKEGRVRHRTSRPRLAFTISRRVRKQFKENP